MDFPGTDITFVYSPDVEHCQMLCTQHASCLFFTFIRADWTRDNRYKTNSTHRIRNALEIRISSEEWHFSEAKKSEQRLIPIYFLADIRRVLDAKTHTQTSAPLCRHFYCYLKTTPSGQPNVRTPLLGVTSGFSLKSCSSDLRRVNTILTIMKTIS